MKHLRVDDDGVAYDTDQYCPEHATIRRVVKT